MGAWRRPDLAAWKRLCTLWTLALAICATMSWRDLAARVRDSLGIALASVGLLALAACARLGSDVSAVPTTVHVTLSEFKVESSVTAFRAGVPYRLTVINQGQVNHELIIVKPLGDDASREVIAEAAMVQIGELDLPPGAQQTVMVTFPEAAPSGSLEFACQLPRHHEFGMHLAVTVT